MQQHIHTMAKRKSERDPEDLPDAPDKGKQKNEADSDSDEVCDTSTQSPMRRKLTETD